MLIETRATSDSSLDRDRRIGLIHATQSLVAEGGPNAATVRAISSRAGVTQGLIRHYFGSKDGLLREAFAALMDAITEKSRDAIEGVGAEPGERLAIYIATTLRPPVLDSGTVGLWAGYMHRLRADAELLQQHEKAYLRFRDMLQTLIAALDRPQSATTDLRREAIACHALIDGLWLEGSLLADLFAPGEVVRIGLAAVGNLLQVDLLAHTTFIPEIGMTLKPGLGLARPV